MIIEEFDNTAKEIRKQSAFCIIDTGIRVLEIATSFEPEMLTRRLTEK